MAGRNDEEVRILVTAKDEASKTLANVGDSMGGLAKQAGGFGAAMTTAIGTFAGGAALNLAAKGFETLTGVVTDGISGAREAAAGYAELETVMKSMGGVVGLTTDELAGMASDLSQAEGMSTFTDDAILGFENMLLTFSNVRGDIFRQATRLGVDMATFMGQEPAAAAQQLGKALQDPVKGITALTRVGITFTDAQKDQIKAMVEAGDVAGAQTVILGELEKQFGGQAEAAAKAAGPWAQITEVMGEFAEEIGTALLPLIDAVGQALLGGPMQRAFAAIIPIVGLVVDSFITLGQALSGEWTDQASKILPLHRIIGNIGLVIRTVIQAVQGLGEAFQHGGIEQVIQVLGLKIQAALPIIQETLAGWGQAFLAWIEPMIPPFLEKLQSLILAVGTWFVEQYPLLVEKAATWAAAFLDWIGPMIPPFLEKVGELLLALLGWMAEQVPTIAAKLGEWAIALTQWIGPRIPIIIEEIGKLLTALLNWMRDNTKDIDKTLEDWAYAFGAWVMEKGWPALQAEMLKLGESMDTWMAEQATTILNNALAWGKGIVDGLLKGVKDNWNRFTTWITDQLRKIPGFDLLFGGGSSSGQGGGSGPFAAPMGLAAAGAGVVSGVTVPSVQMVPRRRVEDVPHRGVIVAPPVVINVDARGSRDPVEVERAGYRGARRALEEAARDRVGRRSVQRLRTALDRRARIR